MSATLYRERAFVMYRNSLHPDDLPPVQATQLDGLLLRQLEEATGKRFYQSCGPITRTLLSSCHWYFTTKASSLTLIIVCYDIESYWQMTNAIPHIVGKLKQFSDSAKIRLCPPTQKGIPWELRLDEILEDGTH